MANTSLTVTFLTEVITDDSGEPIEASIQVALDSARNNDRTSFLYGSKAYYQVFTAPSTLTLTNTPSDGTITSEGAGLETIETIITFPNTNQSSVTYPVYSIESTEWLGNDLGAVHSEGDKIVSAQAGVGVLKITYKAYFRRYAISVPQRDEDEYRVIVYILGTI